MGATAASDLAYARTRNQHGRYPEATTVEDFQRNLAAVRSAHQGRLHSQPVAMPMCLLPAPMGVELPEADGERIIRLDRHFDHVDTAVAADIRHGNLDTTGGSREGLLGTIGGNLACAMADAKTREASLITFQAAADNITMLGIGGAFWGLVIGLLAYVVLNGQISWNGPLEATSKLVSATENR